MTPAESIAKAFHESYERQAPEHGYQTRERSAVPWEDVPADNKSLMIAVVSDLLARDVIREPRRSARYASAGCTCGGSGAIDGHSYFCNLRGGGV